MTTEESNKIQKLYELYEQPMYRIAYAVLKNTAYAEDAVSDAFMRIISKIGKIGDPSSPKTKSYVVKIIKNTAIDCYRRNMYFYSKVTETDEETQLIPDNSINVEDEVFGDNTSEMLETLSDTDKRIMILRCSEELSWREVAKTLSITESNVRKRFERARKKLLKKEELCNEKK